MFSDMCALLSRPALRVNGHVARQARNPVNQILSRKVAPHSASQRVFCHTRIPPKTNAMVGRSGRNGLRTPMEGIGSPENTSCEVDNGDKPVLAGKLPPSQVGVIRL